MWWGDHESDLEYRDAEREDASALWGEVARRMKVYLAAGFSRKNEIANKTAELQDLGVTVTSTWPSETADPKCKLSDLTDEFMRETAIKDLAEIDAADAVILFTQEPTVPFCRGGRMHEFGYANGRGKDLIVCGPRENIFHHRPEVEVFPTWEALKAAIKEGSWKEK